MQIKPVSDETTTAEKSLDA